jgi:hypothetical protein
MRAPSAFDTIPGAPPPGAETGADVGPGVGPGVDAAPDAGTGAGVGPGTCAEAFPSNMLSNRPFGAGFDDPTDASAGTFGALSDP